MPGVEILFAEEVFVSVWNAFVWHWGCFFAGFFAITALILGIVIEVGEGKGSGGYVVAGALVAVILGIICFVGFKNLGSIEVYDHTEYKVIVDESVDMNEFFSKYELIETEGKIYHVKNEVRLNEEED